MTLAGLTSQGSEFMGGPENLDTFYTLWEFSKIPTEANRDIQESAGISRCCKKEIQTHLWVCFQGSGLLL